MGEQHAESGGEQKRCPVCGEQIWVNAQKCIHCESDFTWRKYLAFGNTTLALLTALISVLSVSVPALLLQATPDNSVLSSVFVGVSQSGRTLSMLFNNSGRRTGAINNVRVFVAWDSGAKSFMIDPEQADYHAVFVDPGKSTPGEFGFDGARIHWEPNEAKNDLKILDGILMGSATCTVLVRGTNADDSTYEEKRDFSCTRYGLQIFHRLVHPAGASRD